MLEQPLAPGPLDSWLHPLLPVPTAALSVRVRVRVRVMHGLRVLALRHLAGGKTNLISAVAKHGLSLLPGPGTWRGIEPCMLWTSTSEYLLLTTSAQAADDVLQALPADSQCLAYALDQSAGYVALELCGPGLDALLSRLMDATAVPQQAGRATRTRFMDVAVVALRKQAQGALMLFDRSQADYAVRWIRYALEATEGHAE